jgi:predicted metal-dependent peptidase
MERTIREVETDYVLDEVLIPWLQQSMFFGEMSRHVKKFATDSFPTAAVMYDSRSDDIAMGYNPIFMKRQTRWQSEGLLSHEFYHLIFGHLFDERSAAMPLPKLKNVATDLANNSIIKHNAQEHRPRVTERNDSPLPHGGLIPGEWPTMDDGREPTDEEKEGRRLGAIIARLPPMLSSEQYYNLIKEEAKKERKAGKKKGKGKKPCDQPGMGGKGKGDPGEGEGEPGEEGEGGGGGGISLDDLLDEEGQTLDDHDFWDTVPEDKRQYVEGKIRSMVQKAVNAADNVSNGWGNMPAEIRDAIRRSVSNIVDWKAVLKQFIGSINPGGRSTSIRRMNRKYPKIHPGLKRGRVAKLLIAIDQSGSVYDAMLLLFFAELVTLTRRVEVDIVHFDTVCGEVYTWRKGSVPVLQRTKQGGTDFNAPTRLANHPSNRGRWDALLIMSDGSCAKPVSSRVKRGWVLGKGCKLNFPSTDLQVSLDDGKRVQGAWR